jgi:hypothetical protein
MSQHPTRLFGRCCGMANGHGLVASHPRAERVRLARGLLINQYHTKTSAGTQAVQMNIRLEVRRQTRSCVRNRRYTVSATATTAVEETLPLSQTPSSTSVSAHKTSVAAEPHQRLILRSGGFGIPKPHPPSTPPSSSPSPTSATSWPRSSTDADSLKVAEGGTRAVQIGEDAYFFVRGSMGVSDGVGKNKVQKPRPRSGPDDHSAPHSSGKEDVDGAMTGLVSRISRLGATQKTEPELQKRDPARFSQLLMHFCAAEADARETARVRRRKARAAQRIRASRDHAEREEQKGDPGGRGGTEAEVDATKTEEAGGEGMDPIEIMQLAYERTVDCVRAEVSHRRRDDRPSHSTDSLGISFRRRDLESACRACSAQRPA